ncbi:TonB-dependent receptor [uncultured Flavobacterium sp.]|uniref:TonB-dependent receptor plug domain-containing protein n=1 Tax=uncultured Flavobacterium sp. TaxID=165435 RepID=UPI0030EDC0E2|tara:strand:+ start:35862 stop:37676 length:1815 start_codon:yes stop_codon:yes gene_type:complete
MKNTFLIASLAVFTLTGKAQDTQQKTDSLREVVVTSSRIDLPFDENSRTIQIVTASDIQKLGVTNVADALQQVAGIDVRRQGVNGMQADLYIRGGSFDQTLLLIDGIKVDDPQTGHHTLNLALPIEVIERIEIIKGPAARIFGQNAFSGAVNIVTKNAPSNALVTKFQAGSYDQFLAEATGSVNLENSSHIVHFSKNFSNGYRENTDFDNQNLFVKSQFNKNKLPINLIASHSERKFGAQNFYGVTFSSAIPYEETQTSLVGLSTVIKKGNFNWKPKVYWRRNQDEFLLKKNDPSFYRNLHITNKFAGELNGSYDSNLGTTGFGIEFSKYVIQSNNLGDAEREIATLFLEHRFQFLDNKLDVTPGIAASYFSDFDNKLFPGIDLGYKINNEVKVYGNIGYTYRVPTYTDLYYRDSSTAGNPNLQAESAFAQELGLKYNLKSFQFNAALFNRKTDDFIDYRRATPSDLWKPLNIDVRTQGIESSLKFMFDTNSITHQIHLNYTYIDDNIDTSLISKNGINSMKHQAIINYNLQIFKRFKQNIAYKYVERTSGVSYNVFDLNTSYKINDLELTALFQNIFNTEYFEHTYVPMPKGNMMLGLKYTFR